MGEAGEKVKEFAKNHKEEVMEFAGAGLVMMLKGFVFSILAFIARWSIYIGVAAVAIWYFASKRGAATTGAASHQRASKLSQIMQIYYAY